MLSLNLSRIKHALSGQTTFSLFNQLLFCILFMKMKIIPMLFLVCVMVTIELASVNSAPVGTLLVGTPFLFNKFDYKVDPNRGASLSPAFQNQHGPYGQTLVNYFGTGNL